MDLLTFETRIAGSVNMDLTDADEKTLIDGWVNEAVEQFLVDTSIYRTVDTMDTTAGEGDYTLPAPVIAMKHLIVESNDEQVPLEPMNEFDLLYRRRVETANDYPMYYALSGSNLLRIWPTPSGVVTLIIDFVPQPTNLLSSDAHDPSDVAYGGIPTWCHPTLEAYGKWKANEWDDDISSQVGQVFKLEYDAGVKKARARMNTMRGRWAPARAGTRRRFPVKPGVDRGF